MAGRSDRGAASVKFVIVITARRAVHGRREKKSCYFGSLPILVADEVTVPWLVTASRFPLVSCVCARAFRLPGFHSPAFRCSRRNAIGPILVFRQTFRRDVSSALSRLIGLRDCSSLYCGMNQKAMKRYALFALSVDVFKGSSLCIAFLH